MHNYHLGNEASAKAWLMQKVNDKISTYVFTDSMMSIYTQGQDSALNTKMVPTVDTNLRNRKEVHLGFGMDILNLRHHNQLTI